MQWTIPSKAVKVAEARWRSPVNFFSFMCEAVSKFCDGILSFFGMPLRAATALMRSPAGVYVTAFGVFAILNFSPAHAAGFTNATTQVTTVVTWLKTVCVLIFTACLIWVGWKKMYGGAQWSELGGAIAGGIISGSATALATMFGTPD